MTAAAAVAALAAVPATAHHSFAAYDTSQTLPAEGTLKEFRWGAPHSSLVLIYLEKGDQKQMSIVSGSPLAFSKEGFNPRDFRRGDRLKVTYHPNRSGQPGGSLVTLTLPDGKIFSAAGAAPPGGN
jgi:hypothetical protein